MSTDLEQRLRHHYAAVADELPPAAMTFGDVLDARVSASLDIVDETPRGRRHPARSWALAAATLLVVVAGLAAITGRWTDDGPDAPVGPATAGRTLLSDVTDLQAFDWVIATTLPDGVEWMYSVIGGILDDRDRSSLYGTTSGGVAGEDLRVSIGQTFRPPNTGEEPVDIAGTEWILNTTNPAQWTAVRQLATTVVVVSGRGPFGQVDRDVLAGLVVAPESAFPSPALDGRSPAVSGLERAVVVAEYELDGVVSSLAVQESNAYWCIWVDQSGGCGSHATDPTARLTIDGGDFDVADGATIGRSREAGTVTADAARVEVEFADGTVATVTPTDLSGRFDRRFWIVAADLPFAERSVVEVRAYGADDQLLATATPS